MKVSRRQALYLTAGLGVGALAYLGLRRSEPMAEGFAVEVVSSNLSVPWSLVFLNTNEAVFTERRGAVRLLDLNSGRVENLGLVDVAAVGEAGLLGVAVWDERLFLYYTYRAGAVLTNRVSSFTYGGGLGDEVVIVDGIPGANIHDGGRIGIGPDGLLYITTGDAGDSRTAQNVGSLAGKILRLKRDGGIPADNPFPNSAIFSLGHRNPQGISWQRETNLLFSTEHGPTGEGGRFANDELNIIVPGGNYGWPEIVGDEKREPYVSPLLHSGGETWAPSGCSFYHGKLMYEWSGNLFFATLRGEHLHRVVLGQENRVEMHEKLLKSRLGRLRDVVEGPDGALYVLTSNRDGRGVPAQNDDKIVRIAPRG
ncbi:MAG: PQQ-dependent sugar dehydrogenase [Nitrososphaerota archaeon]